MDKHAYLEIRAKLRFSPSVGGAVATLAMIGSSFCGAVWLLQRPSNGAFLGSQLLFAIAGFQAFALLHDCGHGSFASNKALNTVVGHLASVLCLTPYYSWTYIHHQHHVWSGNVDRDPAVSTLGRWRREGRVPLVARIAWRCWIPVVALSQQIVFALYPLRMLREGKLSLGKAWRSAASVLFIAGVLGLARFVWPEQVSLENFALAWFLYLFITEVVNVPHHTDRESQPGRLPVWKQPATVRSCLYPPVVSEIMALNFNFHIEHHVFPTLPWYRLRQARALLKPALGDDYTESRGIRWVVANRIKSLSDVALVTSTK